MAIWIRCATDLGKESDRGCVLIVCALLDDLLVLLFKTMFRASSMPSKHDVDMLLTQPNAPLGSLATRSRMAFCLGVVSKETRMALDEIRRLRNQYAHEWASSSLSEEDLARLLQWVTPDEQTFMERILDPTPPSTGQTPITMKAGPITMHAPAVKGDRLGIQHKGRFTFANPLRARLIGFFGSIAIRIINSIHDLDANALHLAVAKLMTSVESHLDSVDPHDGMKN